MAFARSRCVGLALGLFWGAVACAADPLTAGMRLAATCANCHGSEGVSAGGEFASLAGRPKADMLATLRALRSGREPATIMQQLLRGYSEEELELIAAYYASAPRPKGGGRG